MTNKRVLQFRSNKKFRHSLNVHQTYIMIKLLFKNRQRISSSPVSPRAATGTGTLNITLTICIFFR